MGNHSIDCEFCGEDLRGGGHAQSCPVPAYEAALRVYHEQEHKYVEDLTTIWRQTLEHEEREAHKRFRAENHPPPRPLTLWDGGRKLLQAKQALVSGATLKQEHIAPKTVVEIDSQAAERRLVADVSIPLCARMKYTLHGNETCDRPQGHEGACRFVEHDCLDCGTHHGTCRQCGTTHGDSHSDNCPHVNLKRKKGA